MRRDLQDFLDEPPFGLIIAGALGLIVTVFAFIGFRNLQSDDDVDATANSTTTIAAPAAPTPESQVELLFTPATSDGVPCNGLSETVGVLSGAVPGETLLFKSNSPEKVPTGFADSTGSYPIVWRCNASDVGTTWRIQALGQESGGLADIVLTGRSPSSPGLTDDSGLLATSVRDPFPCDGKVYQLAELLGAEPNEEITFKSPQSSSIRPGTADENGQLQMNWSCEPNQADQNWTVTATGSSSGQAVDIVFSGSVAPNAPSSSTTSAPATTALETTITTAETTTTTEELATTTSLTSSSADTTNLSSSTTSAADLIVQVSEDPFACNGTSRQFAKITNFTPSETVSFVVSPTNEPVRQGQADNNGELLIRWKCDPADAGTEWNLKATGETSGKTVSFSFAGSAPEATTGASTSGGDAGSTSGSDSGSDSGTDSGTDSGSDSGASTQLAVTVIENPFVCDDKARPVAKLSKLESKEVVSFASSDGATYRNGTADSSGNLTVRWRCKASEVGTWNLTATGKSTGKKVEFSILGSAPLNSD